MSIKFGDVRCFAGSVPADVSSASSGSASEELYRHLPGLRRPPCSPGIWRTSSITMQPMARSGRHLLANDVDVGFLYRRLAAAMMVSCRFKALTSD